MQTGSQVRFIQPARNVHGDVSKDFTDWHMEQTFVLGEEITRRLPDAPEGVRIFEVENSNIGGTMTEDGIGGGRFWGWVRSDDVELVEGEEEG